jgi:predicted  nucleic acid-binding Zn-ribbon protein
MTEHEERAQTLDDELDDMQERTEELEGEISEARKDWERKKADPGVPGAPPDPDDDDSEG